MDDLEALRKEVELRYGVTLRKGDPLLAVMAVVLQHVSECVETVSDRNTKNQKALMNELQKLQDALRDKSYPRLEGFNGVDNSSNIRHS